MTQDQALIEKYVDLRPSGQAGESPTIASLCACPLTIDSSQRFPPRDPMKQSGPTC
jgi:hypothetical protein